MFNHNQVTLTVPTKGNCDSSVIVRDVIYRRLGLLIDCILSPVVPNIPLSVLLRLQQKQLFYWLYLWGCLPLS